MKSVSPNNRLSVGSFECGIAGTRRNCLLIYVLIFGRRTVAAVFKVMSLLILNLVLLRGKE